MRQLTQNEIDNAPDWANSVFENGHGALCWFNNIDGYAIRIGNTGDPVQMSDVHYSFKTCKPINAIPRKEFDIFSAKFNGEIGIEQADELSITITEYEQAVTIGINEAEIFAKHFGLIK